MTKSNIKLLIYSLVLITTLCINHAAAQEGRLLSYVLLNQPVNDLIYSPSRGLIYASVPSTGGLYGNYIIAINPTTKQIDGFVFAGSEPNKIVLSSDDQFLYVGLDGSGSIRRIALNDLSADLIFNLGVSSNGANYPEDIAAMPGQPNVIAVSLKNICCSQRHEGVAIYDNGVRLNTVTPRGSVSNEIEAGDDYSSLYGYNNETSEFGFRRLFVDPNGVSVISNQGNSFGAYNLEIRYSSGRVYSSNGRIVDAVSSLPAGTFALGGFANGIVVDATTLINRSFRLCL